MIAPAKYQDDPAWVEHLGDFNFGMRVAKANRRLASSSNRPNRSMAGKWLRYYSHDSGKSKFILQDRAKGEQRPGVLTGGDAFVQLQQLGVSELIWEKTCPHTDETTYVSESHNVAVTTCPRCNRESRVNLDKALVA